MAENSSIQWTDNTLNPWIGCTKVSPGCANCYAEVGPAASFRGVKWGLGQPRQRTAESNWRKPIVWNRSAEKAGIRCKVFCASLADWLDDEVPIEWLADLMVLVHKTPFLDWQLLTKRPENWETRMPLVAVNLRDRYLATHDHVADPVLHTAHTMVDDWTCGTPPPNVWIGTTVENGNQSHRRVPVALAIPAVVHFLSCEPLLGGLDLDSMNEERANCPGVLNLLSGEWWPAVGDAVAEARSRQTGPRVDWVIVGGESGPHARPFDLAWARKIVQQCTENGVAVFVKQLGRKPIENDKPLVLKDSHGGVVDEWPQDLNIRQFPVTVSPGYPQGSVL